MVIQSILNNNNKKNRCHHHNAVVLFSANRPTATTTKTHKKQDSLSPEKIYVHKLELLFRTSYCKPWVAFEIFSYLLLAWFGAFRNKKIWEKDLQFFCWLNFTHRQIYLLAFRGRWTGIWTDFFLSIDAKRRRAKHEATKCSCARWLDFSYFLHLFWFSSSKILLGVDCFCSFFIFRCPLFCRLGEKQQKNSRVGDKWRFFIAIES